MQEPLTREQYFGARMISDPLCLYDFCLECDGAVAVVTTSAERARDLRHPPVYVDGVGERRPRALGPGDHVDGHARRVLRVVGAPPGRASGSTRWRASDRPTSTSRCSTTTSRPMVIMQLEDYGFCGIGEGGPFVADGNIRWPDGSLPVNTHGGNLSEAYIIGMTHVKEAVEQLRGTAVNQVDGAEVALVTGGPASIPVSSLVAARVGARDRDAWSPARRHHRADAERVDRAVLGRGRRAPARACPRCTACGTFRFPPSPFCFALPGAGGRVGRARRRGHDLLVHGDPPRGDPAGRRRAAVRRRRWSSCRERAGAGSSATSSTANPATCASALPVTLDWYDVRAGESVPVFRLG